MRIARLAALALLVTASTSDVFTQAPSADSGQLGLKLESSRAPHETLIVDRLERPTQN